MYFYIKTVNCKIKEERTKIKTINIKKIMFTQIVYFSPSLNCLFASLLKRGKEEKK